jgi:hypothetical protein
MKRNRTQTPRNPEDLDVTDYDDASIKILKCLDRRPKSQASSVVIRRETGLPKHKVEQRIRADGILVRAGLVEKVGYDSATDYAHPPKVMGLTPYARDAIYHGFFNDDEDETSQVILDEEQFVEFERSLSGLESRVDTLHEETEGLSSSLHRQNQYVLENLYYELAMLREMVNELGIKKGVMKMRADECRERSKSGVNLRKEFYSDSDTGQDA